MLHSSYAFLAHLLTSRQMTSRLLLWLLQQFPVLTQLHCATANQIIPCLLSLSSQNEMRLKIYNLGGLNSKCIDDRFDNAIIQRHTHYSVADKLKIVTAVDKMMAKEYLKQNQACLVLQVCDSQVLRWQANRALLEEAARPEKQIMHKGPVGCVDAYTEELVSFVDEWHGKGILVTRLCLIRKACNLSPVFANKILSLPRKQPFLTLWQKPASSTAWPRTPCSAPPKKCATRQTVSSRRLFPLPTMGIDCPPEPSTWIKLPSTMQ
jgi:hypothetical protein